MSKAGAAGEAGKEEELPYDVTLSIACHLVYPSITVWCRCRCSGSAGLFTENEQSFFCVLLWTVRVSSFVGIGLGVVLFAIYLRLMTWSAKLTCVSPPHTPPSPWMQQQARWCRASCWWWWW